MNATHLILILSCVLLSALGQGDSNNINVETDNFHVSVTGNQNVPKYEYWLKSSESNRYGVHLSGIYERVGQVRSGVVALASLSWSFSTPAESDGVVTFDLVSGAVANRFDSLHFRNYISKGGNDTFPETGVKFDIVIENYQWVSASPDAQLVLEFTFQGDENGYFVSSSSASAHDGTNTEVIAVSFEESQVLKKIAFDHFPSGYTLEQDPEFGVSSASILSLSVASCFAIVVALCM